MRPLAVVAMLSCTIPACGSFSSSDPAAAPDAGGDGGAPEAAVDANASDAPGEAAVDPNVVVSDGFENPVGLGCGSQWANRANTTSELAAGQGRNGTSACHVCSSSAGAIFFGLEYTISSAAPAGAAYSMLAWVRLDTGSGDTELSAAFGFDGNFFGGGPVSSKTYVPVTFAASAVGGKLALGYVSGRTYTGTACFYVDDIVIRRDR